MKLTKVSPGRHAARRAGSMKHRPELQWAYGQITETDQDRWKAIEVEPPLTPWAPTEPNVWGDAPPQELPLAKDGHHQQRRGERGDSANEIDKRDRQTRPTPRKGGGHAQDIARERQLGPPQKRTRTPPRRSEGWNG